MTRSKKVGSRRRRFALAGALVACAMMGIGAGSASAVPVNLNQSFDDAALTLPIVGKSDIMDAPKTATIGGTNVIDDTTGTIAGAGLTFPSFTGTASGVPVGVSFANIGAMNGSLVSGVETLTSSRYEADVQLNPPPAASPGDICKYGDNAGQPLNLTFSTTGGSPIAGVAFTEAAGPPVSTTHGIVQATWDSNDFPNGHPFLADGTTPDPSPAGKCDLIDSIVHGGNGQLALGNGFDLVPDVAPPPDTGGGTVAPPPAKKKKCKKKAKKGSAQSAKKSKCKKKK